MCLGSPPFFGQKKVLAIKRLSFWQYPARFPHFLCQFPWRWPLPHFILSSMSGFLITCPSLSVANIGKSFRLSCRKMSFILFQYIPYVDRNSYVGGIFVQYYRHLYLYLRFGMHYRDSFVDACDFLMYGCMFSSIAMSIPRFPLLPPTLVVPFFDFGGVVFCSVCSSSIAVFIFGLSLISVASLNVWRSCYARMFLWAEFRHLCGLFYSRVQPFCARPNIATFIATSYILRPPIR